MCPQALNLTESPTSLYGSLPTVHAHHKGSVKRYQANRPNTVIIYCTQHPASNHEVRFIMRRESPNLRALASLIVRLRCWGRELRPGHHAAIPASPGATYINECSLGLRFRV